MTLNHRDVSIALGGIGGTQLVCKTIMKNENDLCEISNVCADRRSCDRHRYDCRLDHR
jgi:hypothetical protein